MQQVPIHIHIVIENQILFTWGSDLEQYVDGNPGMRVIINVLYWRGVDLMML